MSAGQPRHHGAAKPLESPGEVASNNSTPTAALRRWQTFGRRLMQVQLVCFLLWLLAFNIFIVAFEDEDLSLSFRQMLGTVRGRVAVAAELLALLFMAPFLVLEAGTISTYGWHFFDAWNRLDWATYLLQVS